MIVTPFATYLLAEVVGVSGVLATVVAGLYLGRRSATYFSANTRLQAASFWNVLVFLFNGLIFLLVGLQLRMLVEQIPNATLFSLIGYGLAISFTVIVVRIVWSFAANGILRLLSKFSGYRPAAPRVVVVISWAGMRGGVSLATALALPTTIAGGASFPERDLVIFVTFVVILTTLVLQGLSFGPLIQALDLAKDPGVLGEAQAVLEQATKAALQRMDVLAKENEVPEELVKHIRSYYERKLSLITEMIDDPEKIEYRKRRGTYKQFLLGIRQAERDVLIELRDAGTLDDALFHRMERDFDLEEERLEGH
jgi:CPA1 family monovalent cation:H+ antiporter